MAVSYNKLWKLLVDKKMSKSDLRKKAEIAPNTMTKLRRDEEVSLTNIIMQPAATMIRSCAVRPTALTVAMDICDKCALVTVSESMTFAA